MFSGIVEETGTVRDVTRVENGMRLRIAARIALDELVPGASIAINGVCQTVVTRSDADFQVEAIATTLGRTTLGALAAGNAVNLERALAYGERVGGHLVQGHVNGVGTVTAVQREGEHVLLDVRMPADVADVTVLHGSIAIDGVSLTVNALPAADCVQVALIPYTWEHTTLCRLRPGSRVNLEGDMMGRFVTHWLKRQRGEGV